MSIKELLEKIVKCIDDLDKVIGNCYRLENRLKCNEQNNIVKVIIF